MNKLKLLEKSLYPLFPMDGKALLSANEIRNQTAIKIPPEDMPEEVRAVYKKPIKLEVVKGMVELTVLGSAFKRICLP